MDWTAAGVIVSLIVGALGLLLSMLSLYQQWHANQRRVRVELVSVDVQGDRVVVRERFNPLGAGAVRVINEGRIPVDIEEVGILVARPRAARLIPEVLMTTGGKKLPVIVAAHSACVIPLLDFDLWELARRGVECVYAKSTSGEEFHADPATLGTIGEALDANAREAVREVVSPTNFPPDDGSAPTTTDHGPGESPKSSETT